MNKDRQPDWHDTNMSLFGSDIEKKIKAAAADGEPQWDGAGTKVGLQIWRIEAFKVKPWPRSKYGKFHVGDSYVILNTYTAPENKDKLLWDVHFWIGSESTQDEYGTAAYKTVELDDKLGGAAVQHREVQGSEGDLFLGYFSGHHVTYLAGGVASGFHHHEAEKREAKLFEVKGTAQNLRLREVKCARDAMNSGDVYILDTEEGIYQWNGHDSNAHERAKAAQICTALKNERGGKAAVTLLDEGTSDGESSPFWSHLPGAKRMLGVKVGEIKVKIAEKGGDDAAVKKFEPVLIRISGSASGSARFSIEGRGKLPISKLKTGGIYLYDTGFLIYLWVGKGAGQHERVSAFPFAQKYLKEYKRPTVLPISRYNEGKEPQQFLSLFGPPQQQGCCVIA